ncbi:glycogen debranching N-terminal domain-containing protein [Streptomyces formicae]|uniref:Aminotransferase n=1 Tax=Streptomyces formicae TaxID=1616117 RepID=A0ABY3WMW9_9ACTN|nr:glycogen debranching N-terminal domain-containing protein [Streptomyces formicae]UNM13495.1 aminotransferase [Streptomyces formicae]
MNPSGRVLLVRDGTFAVLGRDGSITGERGAAPDGLFLRDARHLSRWELTVDGTAPAVLVPASDSVPSTSVLTPAGTRDEPPAYTVFREQAVEAGQFTETLRMVSNSPATLTARVELAVGADFADQFELRADDRTYPKPGARHEVQVREDGVEFGYRRDHWHSRTTVTAHPVPDTVSGERLTWKLTLPPHGEAELRIRAAAHPHGAPADPLPEAPPSDTALPGSTGSADPDLLRACRQGLADLDLLRVSATGPDGERVTVPAAGIPWFLTLFGRDSLLTSYFLLPYRPRTAEHTLLALAAAQGAGYDSFRGEQPGRIVHEVRHGELAAFRQVPYGRYYGSVDATPLFLVLLGAHAETTGDTSLALRLESHARAAVDWMLTDGGLTGHGYLVYRPDAQGLVNQNWKDSAGAVCFTDGTQAEGPIAVCEAQGYAYDALVRTARLARTVWHDADWAQELETAAAGLRERFHRDFWMPGQDFPALALDGEGRQVDALASDAGHLLWSGILGQPHGERVGRRLLEPDFFSGWAIRTLASGQAPYHPLSYHRGSAWPHDNAVIALGLARYGLDGELRALASGLTATAALHRYRLPEVLAGYGREEHATPVPYPHSCSPQAWAAAAPLALLTACRAVGDAAAGRPGR